MFSSRDVCSQIHRKRERERERERERKRDICHHGERDRHLIICVDYLGWESGTHI